MSPALAIVWYGCALLLVVLLSIAARRQGRPAGPGHKVPLVKRQAMEILAIISAWLIVASLVLAGLVDILIWAAKYDVPSVSDWVHYTLWSYPWIGWIAAGLAYHLLIDRPHPPGM